MDALMELEDRFDSDYEPDAQPDPLVNCRGELMGHKDSYVYWPERHAHMTIFLKYFGDQVEITCLYEDGTYLPDDALHPMYVEENGNLDAVADRIDAEYRDVSPDFDDPETMDIDRESLGYSFRELNWNPNRLLMIYTWGRQHRKNKPEGSVHNFDANLIQSCRNGPSLKIFTGLHPETQLNIQSARGYSCFMKEIVTRIEAQNLPIISISCSEGKYRSVACAELLQRYFYPRALIYHLHVNK
jgi:hypothetical protein